MKKPQNLVENEPVNHHTITLDNRQLSVEKFFKALGKNFSQTTKKEKKYTNDRREEHWKCRKFQKIYESKIINDRLIYFDLCVLFLHLNFCGSLCLFEHLNTLTKKGNVSEKFFFFVFIFDDGHHMVFFLLSIQFEISMRSLAEYLLNFFFHS